MAILVCGGAGYIGSHNVRALLARGEEAVVIDNFLTGHRRAVPAGVRLHEGDIRDPEALDRVFSENRIDAVLHFAASSLVGESMEKPLAYFNNNVHGMQTRSSFPPRRRSTASRGACPSRRATPHGPPTPTAKAS